MDVMAGLITSGKQEKTQREATERFDPLLLLLCPLVPRYLIVARLTAERILLHRPAISRCAASPMATIKINEGAIVSPVAILS